MVMIILCMLLLTLDGVGVGRDDGDLALLYRCSVFGCEGEQGLLESSCWSFDRVRSNLTRGRLPQICSAKICHRYSDLV